MNFGPIRQAFQPPFGLERRETVSRLLYAILVSVIVIDSIVIINRLWETKASITPTLRVLIALLVLQLILLNMVKRGYIDAAALTQVGISWLLVTYQAWSADGIRDIAIYIYFLIILMAALLTNWRISILLCVSSIAAVWVFAIAEGTGVT